MFGRLHQTDRALFESDRVRQNALILDGWLVLRFTWRMLEEDPAGSWRRCWRRSLPDLALDLEVRRGRHDGPP